MSWWERREILVSGVAGSQNPLHDAGKGLLVYEAQLADPNIYSNAAQLKDATLKFEATKKELATQTSRWEQLV